MQFVSLGWNRQMGSGGGGGDSTLLTVDNAAAFIASLGLTATGVTYGNVSYGGADWYSPTVGTSLLRTLPAAPTALDFEILFRAPATATNQRVARLGQSAVGGTRTFDIYLSSADNLQTFSSWAVVINTAIVMSTIMKIRFIATADGISLSLNDAAPQTSDDASAFTASTLFAIGCQSNVNQLGQPILAFRDNAKNLLNSPYGWNVSAL